jgi:hypothetical protein
MPQGSPNCSSKSCGMFDGVCGYAVTRKPNCGIRVLAKNCKSAFVLV